MNRAQDDNPLRNGKTVIPLLVAAVLLLSVAWIGFPASAESLTVGHHVFEFLEVVYEDDGTSTWRYRVTSGSSPSLSHWVLECERSLGAAQVLDASETIEVGSDPRTDTYGIKFDQGYDDGEARDVWFRLDAWYEVMNTRIATKAGREIDVAGAIPGPSSELLTPPNADNEPPVAVDDTAETVENRAIEIAVLDNDVDPEGSALIVESVGAPSHGTAAPSGTKKVLYTPATGFTGTDSFEVTIADEQGATATSTVIVNVGALNDAPTVVDDHATGRENQPLEIDVLANDSDEDGVIDPMSLTIVRAPRHGTVDVASDGVVRYVPTAGVCGEDTFEYVVSDNEGAISDRAEATLVILCNEPPIALDDEATTEEDRPITLDVLANDSDIDGSLNRTTVTIVRSPRYGSVEVLNTGLVVYTPEFGRCGDIAFEYTVSDDEGRTSDEARVEITVICNEPPIALDDEATTDENTSVGIHVLANDFDPDGRILPESLRVTREPRNGVVSLHISSGVVTYTPDAGACGTDEFSYVVEDEDGAESEEATATIAILCNDPPLAIDDLYTLSEGTTLDVDSPGPLDNDVDSPGSSLTAMLVREPRHGRLTLAEDGSFTYIHDGSETTEDSFTYTASDGVKISNTAAVSLLIYPANDAPTAEDDEGETNEDTPVSLDVLANDFDPDSDALSIDWVAPPMYGTATTNGVRLVYSPDPDWSGEDRFRYTVSDGHGETSTAEVVVLVRPSNDPPSAGDDTAVTDEDTPVSIRVLANDEDRDGDLLVIASFEQPADGWVELDGSLLVYTPDPNFFGDDRFDYVVEDGTGARATAEVRVTVLPINDAPIALDDIGSTDEDTAVLVEVLRNDSDPEGDSISIESVTRPRYGRITHDENAILYTPNEGIYGEDEFGYTITDSNGGTASAIVRVTILPVNDPPIAQDDSAATPESTPVRVPVLENDSDPDGDTLEIASLGRPSSGTVSIDGSDVVYVPVDGTSGVDRFTYTVSDGRGGTDTAEVTIAVAAVNDFPVAQDDEAFTDEDVSIAILVLDNDLDPDGDPLHIDRVTRPEFGTVTEQDGSLVYVPTPDWNGEDRFTYVVSDGFGGFDEAEVHVTVRSVNDEPTAQNDSASTTEDTPIDIFVLENDSDPDGDVLSILDTEVPARGSVSIEGDHVTYVPDPGTSGVDTFVYTVSDGEGGRASATVTVAVAMVNDDPIAGPDDVTTAEDVPVTIDVLANDSDPDSDRLSIESTSRPQHGQVVISGSRIIYTPSPNSSGKDLFTYTVSDGHGGTDIAEVDVTVVGVNDPPIAQDNSAGALEAMPISIAVLSNDHDQDGDILRIESVTQPAHGTVTHDGEVLVYVSDAGFSGTETFSYTVSDAHGGTDTAQVTVVVGTVNDPPIAQDDSATTDEESLVIIPVLANDTDPDGDFLIVESFSTPENGTVLNTRTGLSYVPDEGFNGIDTFTYVVSDGNGGTDRARVTVSVAAVNDAPIAQDDSAYTDEAAAVTVFVLLNDRDPDGDALQIESVTQPNHGTVSITDGELVYVPDSGFHGVDTFTYTIADGRGASDSATVILSVAAVNDPPIAQDDSATTRQETSHTLDVLANDTDPDGDALRIESVSMPQNGSASHDGSVITYMPDVGFSGTDTFTYTVADGRGRTAIGHVTVGVESTVGGSGGGTSEASSCDGRVIISEIAWAGTAADPRDEWIELRNLGTTPVDLTGWTLRWRRTRPTSNDEEDWKEIELYGVIGPASVSACDERAETERALTVIRKESEDGAGWWVDAPLERIDESYYMIERRHQDTIRDVEGQLLYDTNPYLVLDLSDQGEIVMLIDPQGEIIDTANASFLGRDGWAAGSAVTFGSMERIDPLAPDTSANWHTNVGVVAQGTDAKGRPLSATPGTTNSPLLEELATLAQWEPFLVRQGESVRVGFPLSRQDRRTTGWPWIHITRPGDLAGAGGAIQLTDYSFSGRYTSATEYALDVGTVGLSTGLHVIWVTYGQGRAVVLPLRVTL